MDNRPIQIISNNKLSLTATTSTGVLQGGTLAPLQFTYYINTLLDKPLHGTHRINAYADDLAFLCIADTSPNLPTKPTSTQYPTFKIRTTPLHCITHQNKLLTFNCKLSHLQYKNHCKQHKKIYTTSSSIRLNPLCHTGIPPAKHP
jgi:hypothetical protein